MERTVTVTNPHGLHARPAACFVKTAMEFESEITVTCGDRVCNGKSLLSILYLGVDKGSAVTVSAEGEDEAQALDALEPILQGHYDTPGHHHEGPVAA